MLAFLLSRAWVTRGVTKFREVDVKVLSCHVMTPVSRTRDHFRPIRVQMSVVIS